MTWNPEGSLSISGRLAAIFWRHSNIRELSQRNPGADRELDRAVEIMRRVAAARARSFADATLHTLDRAERPESLERMSVTSQEAAELLHMTPAGVRKAITENRLRAERVGRQWDIDLNDIEDFIARRDQND